MQHILSHWGTSSDIRPLFPLFAVPVPFFSSPTRLFTFAEVVIINQDSNVKRVHI